MDQRHLSETWEGLTGAFIVDIRRIRNPKQSVRYVTKYVNKSPPATFTERRYSLSKNFLPTKTKKSQKGDYCWAEPTFERGHIEQVVDWNFPETSWEKLTPNHWVKSTQKEEGF